MDTQDNRERCKEHQWEVHCCKRCKSPLSVAIVPPYLNVVWKQCMLIFASFLCNSYISIHQSISFIIKKIKRIRKIIIIINDMIAAELAVGVEVTMLSQMLQCWLL